MIEEIKAEVITRLKKDYPDGMFSVCDPRGVKYRKNDAVQFEHPKGEPRVGDYHHTYIPKCYDEYNTPEGIFYFNREGRDPVPRFFVTHYIAYFMHGRINIEKKSSSINLHLCNESLKCNVENILKLVNEECDISNLYFTEEDAHNAISEYYDEAFKKFEKYNGRLKQYIKDMCDDGVKIDCDISGDPYYIGQELTDITLNLELGGFDFSFNTGVKEFTDFHYKRKG